LIPEYCVHNSIIVPKGFAIAIFNATPVVISWNIVAIASAYAIIVESGTVAIVDAGAVCESAIFNATPVVISWDIVAIISAYAITIKSGTVAIVVEVEGVAVAIFDAKPVVKSWDIVAIGFAYAIIVESGTVATYDAAGELATGVAIAIGLELREIAAIRSASSAVVSMVETGTVSVSVVVVVDDAVDETTICTAFAISCAKFWEIAAIVVVSALVIIVY